MLAGNGHRSSLSLEGDDSKGRYEFVWCSSVQSVVFGREGVWGKDMAVCMVVA